MAKQTRNKTNFTTIRVEGAILPIDLLERIAKNEKDIKGLREEEDYHLSGEKFKDAITQSWNRLRGAWANFQSLKAKLTTDDTGTTITREKWLLPLFQQLGYGRLNPTKKSFDIDEKSYPISHLWEQMPIHLVGCNLDLDKRSVAGTSRTSPHSMVQELLNRSKDYLWAFVSNGLRLRILRDNVSLTRQAYVEFDIESMMQGEVYPDFVLLWLLCHQSRVEAEKPEEFWLEKWSKTAQEQGTRFLENLRKGVERAISLLGSGFLANTNNKILRNKLQTGQLNAQDYYRQLLRLVYRLLFLFVAEDRELLLDPNANQEIKERYTKYYSTAKLRKLAGKRKGTKHNDLWQGLRIVMQKLGNGGCAELALPALGSFLFSNRSLPDLDGCEIDNQALLETFRALAYTEDANSRRPVDYKNLRSEELGSVYESLLELHPIINANVDAATFELKSVSGNERKTTGSYYTPESLVQCLLDSALDPVIDEAIKGLDSKKAEAAILNLKVCDPACGSGHFLVAAAHRMAKRLASTRTSDSEPAPTEIQKALRDVIGRCIYGVDINEMAVELCKVALWMEAIEPGKPLSFLEHHIQCGNSLLGTTPALMADGIPDEAFNPIEGDDKKKAAVLKKQNKKEREGRQGSMFAQFEGGIELGSVDLLTKIKEIDQVDDDSILGIRRKQELYEQFILSDYKQAKVIADAWCAAFVWKKTAEAPLAVTEDIFWLLKNKPQGVPSSTLVEIERLATQYKFFHWHLALPNVFHKGQLNVENKQTGWSGGFDVVLGNPPWDKIQPEEQKFFASIRSDIANTENSSLRKQYITQLEDKDPCIYQLWVEHKRYINAISLFVKQSGFLVLTSTGNLNTYRLFSELASKIINSLGKAGLIVQSGLATDESGKEFFSALLSEGKLTRFLDFENKGVFFPEVHSSFRFSLITITGSNLSKDKYCEFGWLLGKLSDLSEEGKLIYLNSTDLLLFNPTSHTCPIFKSQKDVIINQKIYKAGDYIYVDLKNRFGNIDFQGELFNLTRDSKFFSSSKVMENEEYLPLYEAKCIHSYDHRFATYTGKDYVESPASLKNSSEFYMKPKSLVQKREVERRASKQGINSRWMCGFRDIARATDERTAIFTILPFVAVGNSINLLLGLDKFEAAIITANGNSFIFDYACRQKISGMHVNIWIMKQLPIIPLTKYSEYLSRCSLSQLDWFLNRVLELSYTAWDLEAFAKDCGYKGPPFKWDEERRFLIRAELDAAYFHLYGIARDDVDYIMETFPIVKRKDEKAFGEYRTKRVILEVYDAMAETMKTGQSYQTIVSPPPADPSVAHPPQEGFS